jgi:hypothetical protein
MCHCNTAVVIDMAYDIHIRSYFLWQLAAKHALALAIVSK